MAPRVHINPGRIVGFALLFLTLSPAGPAPGQTSQPGPPPELRRIAFGSCAQQDRPQPIWTAVAAARPDLLILLGDNIYGDTEDMQAMRNKYARFAAVEGFAALRKTCPLIATWDDHDFGRNDAGAEYPKKPESQQAMLDFLGERADSPRRKREGVYEAYQYGPPEQRVQVILLDTRYFRSPLKRRTDPEVPGDGRPGRYAPNDDPEATILGEAQWKWLEEQLRVPARLRILGSSIQLVSEEHGFEKWMNFPRERERLLKLIRQTRADGVIAISGDRHTAELSVLDEKESGLGYPLYDLTSSALNQERGFTNELNRHRLGMVYAPANFGLIEIDWGAPDPKLRLQIRDASGAVVIRHDLPLSRLRAP